MKTLRGLIRVIKQVGKKIGWVVTTILLIVIYLVGIGVSALIAKSIRKHFLKLKPEKDKTTYWLNKTRTEITLEDFQRSF